MIKKQTLKLITKFALKMNDERFFKFIDHPLKNQIKKIEFGREFDD